MRLKLSLLLLLSSSLFPQGVTSGTARRIIRAASLPATCQVGDVYFKTTTTIGLYQCRTLHSWTQVYIPNVVGDSVTAFQVGDIENEIMFNVDTINNIVWAGSYFKSHGLCGMGVGDFTTAADVGISRSAAGKWLLDNGCGSSGFGMLQFGATTSGYPAIKRNGTALNFRLADDSADAPITASTATLSVPLTLASGGTNCAAPYAINPQAATYQAVAADFDCFKTITVASGTFTITLVASTSQPVAGTWLKIINYGSGVVTVARSGQNLNGGTTSLTISAGSATAPLDMFVHSDGANYFISK